MNRNHLRTFISAIVAGVLSVVLAPNAAALSYTTFMNPLGPAGTVARGVEGNVIVGYYADSTDISTRSYHGYRYDGTTFTTLDYNPLDHNFATGISGSKIVGQVGNGAQAQGWIYDGASYTAFAHPSGVNGTFPQDISGNTVVGFYSDNNQVNHGFVYDGATFTTLNNPAASYSAAGRGTIVSDISGSTLVGAYRDSANKSHGFIYDGTTYTTLDHPLGVNGSVVAGISGSNLVGYYYDSSVTAHGFFYNGSAFMTIDVPGTLKGTIAEGIDGNNIVGSYNFAPYYPSSFITQVPEPSSMSLALGGVALGLIGIRRRRKARTRNLR